MSANVGYATLNVIPSAKGFGPALTRDLGGDFDTAGRDGGKKMGGALIPAFGALLAPAMLAAGGLAIGSFVKGSIASAGALEQSVGAIQAVFKEAAPAMENFSFSASKNFGLAANEVNELSTILGTQLKNAGVSMDQLAPKTQSLIGVGADLSAMFGGSTREAVEALSSALKGERDPIERYGVSLNQAAIDAEAASLGFEKVGGTLSAEANQAATLSLIMKQTADAHGAAAREAGSLQSQQQRLGAGWENLKATIGQAFLPAAAGATGVLADLVAGAMPLIQSVGPGLSSMFATVGPALTQLGAALLQLLPNLSPVGIAFQALMPVLPLIGQLLAQIATVIAGNLTVVAQALTPVIQQIAAVLSGVLAQALPTIADLFGRLAPVLGQAAALVGQLVAAIMPLIGTLLETLMPILDALMPLVSTVFSFILDVVTTAINAVSGIINAVMLALRGDWDGAWRMVGDTLAKAWDGITRAVGNALDGLLAWFGALPGHIWGAISGIGEWLWDAGRNLIQGLLDGAGSLLRNIGSFFLNMLSGWIVDPFKAALGIHSPSRVFKEFGVNIGEGLIDGIGSMGSLVERASDDLAEQATSRFNGLDYSAKIDAAVNDSPLAQAAQALVAGAGSGDGPTLNYTQIGGQGLTAEQELIRAARRLKYAA